jgi:succinate dehydrogenase/fumarate reductase flavoprotein subunit
MTENNSMSAELVDHILQNIEHENLTEWEKDFVKSLTAYWKRNHKLSEKQMKRLKEVWEESRNAKRVFRDKS